ncbi:MAG: SDR family NAD(P)-dependent oxidoreductase [Anaerolineales bacterium]|jgi:NAD(P)-dependent dehydrogenase (short-subunit alcohol dehydrogenase family)
MLLLDGKVAIVTGAAQGIGLAIADTFAEQGAHVVLADIQLEEAREAARVISANTGRPALALKLDVTDRSQAEETVSRAVQEYGRLDILVNNAGVHRPHPVLDFPEADWDAVFEVNVKGTFLCSQAAARVMVKQGQGGSIVIISSASGKKPDRQGAAYCASKSAQIGLMRVLALELGEYRIRVNAILPGATDTALLRNLFASDPGLEGQLRERTPLGKMALPSDQANAALFLASDLASHVTGEQLVVSGGEFMAG